MLKEEKMSNDRQSFYHAQVSKGTNLSTFDPFWRRKIYGLKNSNTGMIRMEIRSGKRFFFSH
jgi:hypothetical protein